MAAKFQVEHYFTDDPSEAVIRTRGTEAIEMIDQAFCDALVYELGDEVRIHGPPYFQLRRLGSAVLVAARQDIEIIALAPLGAISQRISSEIKIVGSNVSILDSSFLYAETRLRDMPK